MRRARVGILVSLTAEPPAPPDMWVRIRQFRSDSCNWPTAQLIPREVFRSAIRDAANSILLVHNHPSGDPTPSGQDISVTERLEQTAEIVGIPVIDHIVVGADKAISIQEWRSGNRWSCTPFKIDIRWHKNWRGGLSTRRSCMGRWQVEREGSPSQTQDPKSAGVVYTRRVELTLFWPNVRGSKPMKKRRLLNSRRILIAFGKHRSKVQVLSAAFSLRRQKTGKSEKSGFPVFVIGGDCSSITQDCGIWS